MTDKLAIGVDIGGTKIAAVLIDRSGTVIASHHGPTGASDGADAVIDRVVQSIEILLKQATANIAVNLGLVEVPLDPQGSPAPVVRRTRVFAQRHQRSSLGRTLFWGSARLRQVYVTHLTQ